MSENNLLNGISVDFEEYYHASNLAPFIGTRALPSRVQLNLEKTLRLFEASSVKATFFVLAQIAVDKPELIKQITAEGHEVAAHSFTHRCIYNLSKHEFIEEAKKAKEVLEDITGTPVLGFRAPNFSINDQTPWAYEVLASLGYRYDSSIYPIYHPRYSNPKRSRRVETVETPAGPLLTVPLATYRAQFLNWQLNLPIAGGAYWRLLPSWPIKKALQHVNIRENRPNFCYFHPWELDPEQPKLIPGYSLTAWRHYGGAANFSKVISSYLSALKFTDYQTTLGLKSV